MGESVGKMVGKAVEVVSAVKVMEAKFEALDRQFARLEDLNRQFEEHIKADMDELRRRIATLEGMEDARGIAIKDVGHEVKTALRSVAEEIRDARIQVPSQSALPDGSSGRRRRRLPKPEEANRDA